MSAYVEIANQVLILKERGWTEKYDFWSHPKYVSRNFRGGKWEIKLYLYTFEQAIRMEGIE